MAKVVGQKSASEKVTNLGRMKTVVVKPTGHVRGPFGPRAVGNIKGVHWRWGTHKSHKRAKRMPADKYIDLTGVKGYEGLQKKGHRVLAVRLGPNQPSSKHIYYVKRRKR